jgi:hypothetical protein
MKKVIAISLILVACCVTGFGQKATTVTVSTTTSLKDALHICKFEGEVQGFFSDDYGDEPDRFTMQSRIPFHIIKIEISAAHPGDTTILVLTMPHVPNTLGFEHRLTDCVNGLKKKLENVEIGKYEVIREQ